MTAYSARFYGNRSSGSDCDGYKRIIVAAPTKDEAETVALRIVFGRYGDAAAREMGPLRRASRDDRDVLGDSSIEIIPEGEG